jgi:hypothetical protein
MLWSPDELRGKPEKYTPRQDWHSCTLTQLEQWSGDVEFMVLDEIIDNETFETHLKDAGQFIGVGRFRPRNNGYYGRFSVEKVVWN